MAKTYTEEQLNTFDKATLIQLLLMQQSQLQKSIKATASVRASRCTEKQSFW